MRRSESVKHLAKPNRLTDATAAVGVGVTAVTKPTRRIQNITGNSLFYEYMYKLKRLWCVIEVTNKRKFQR